MIVKRIMFWIGLSVLALVILIAGGWCALAIWYRLPVGEALRVVAAGLTGVATIVAVIFLCTRQRRKAVAGFAFLFWIVWVWWGGILPSNDRHWTPDVAQNVTGIFSGNQLVVRNVRNFNWRSDTDFDQNWEQRSYNVANVNSVDLIMSYWAGEAIAHTIISFGFSDGQRLDFSVETRKEQGESYSTIAGFFKQYELIIIAADERDVVRVRSNVRGEDVRIYHLRIPPAEAQLLLRAYINEANGLAAKPQFYNTLTTNCTTLVFKLVRLIQPGVPWDPRVLISGYLPDYVYSLGAMDNQMPFDQLRTLSKIHDKALAAGDDPNFSADIRVGIPGP